jgi:TonB family protein
MKNLIKPLLGLFITALFFTPFVKAQTNKPSQTINGGVVNGKAVSLVKPEYPPEASKEKISGAVNVLVVIDESGNVISAKAVSGIDNAALRTAAENAALKSKFSPTTLSGEPVKVTGTIVYNFVEAVVSNETAAQKENAVAAVVSNEAKVKPFAVSMFIYVLRSSANDIDKFNKAFASDDFIKDTIDEFSADFPGLKRLADVSTLPPAQRLARIDEAISAIKSKLNSADLWQFEVGKAFAGIMEQFFALSGEQEPDLSKFDEKAVKQNLAKIKESCASAPAEFPRDVLAKLEDLAKFESDKTILSAEHFGDFFNRVKALFETISPDSTR